MTLPWTDTLKAPPQKPAVSCNERFMAARHNGGCYEKNVFMYVLICKGLSNGVVWGALFQEVRPGAGLKTGDFV